MTPFEAYMKCKKENKRILELEDIIICDPKCSYYYANDIIKGPWEKGEDSISKNPQYSYWYATDIIKGPWEKGEDSISKNPQYSYWYATDIIKGPFEKSHPIIFNSQYNHDYIKLLKRKKYDLNKINEWLI